MESPGRLKTRLEPSSEASVTRLRRSIAQAVQGLEDARHGSMPQHSLRAALHEIDRLIGELSREINGSTPPYEQEYYAELLKKFLKRLKAERFELYSALECFGLKQIQRTQKSSENPKNLTLT